jgi:hypothetical protein
MFQTAFAEANRVRKQGPEGFEALWPLAAPGARRTQFGSGQTTKRTRRAACRDAKRALVVALKPKDDHVQNDARRTMRGSL